MDLESMYGLRSISAMLTCGCWVQNPNAWSRLVNCCCFFSWTVFCTLKIMTNQCVDSRHYKQWQQLACSEGCCIAKFAIVLAASIVCLIGFNCFLLAQHCQIVSSTCSPRAVHAWPAGAMSKDHVCVDMKGNRSFIGVIYMVKAGVFDGFCISIDIDRYP